MADVNLDPFNLEMDYKIWFEKVTNDGSQSLIGEKKIELLIAIHKLGSIKAAADVCNFDFKVAWDMINSANERFAPHDLVVSTRGRGGGSYLTPLGLEILQQYERMNSIIKSILPKILNGYMASVVDVAQETNDDISMKLQLHLNNNNNNNLDASTSKIWKNNAKVFIIPIGIDEEI
ncbi:MAG: hypothetical protein HeimC2_46030 [Candidatus Heimdallarchaeota archaeon LC_2]|nr:MAG: hypothetical protein HeimC2_46030 [Candidatus Heimdallarchaeota archaeon LC_2]